jgi:membrane protein YqaA with SNARE-associated domain
MFVILALLKIGFGQLMTNAIVWFYDKIGLFGLYVGVFIISTFGNFTVIFPVPYTFALFAVATIPGANVFLIGLSGAMGATIGELSAWAIGKSSQEALGESEKIQRMKKYVDRGWAPVLIFIFAATPLPDDAFLIVLGFANYKFKKIFPWMFIGKFCLCAFNAAIPIWLMNIPMNGEFGTWLFNLYNAGVTVPDPSWGTGF